MILGKTQFPFIVADLLGTRYKLMIEVQLIEREPGKQDWRINVCARNGAIVGFVGSSNGDYKCNVTVRTSDYNAAEYLDLGGNNAALCNGVDRKDKLNDLIETGKERVTEFVAMKQGAYTDNL